MAPSSVSTLLRKTAMSDYLELQRDEWNNVVGDDSQCMRLSQQEEIKYLSNLNKNLGEYLKLHPEMAHELMVPSGFMERIPRHYERMLCGKQSLSSQNGMLEEARVNEEILGVMMNRPYKVLKNPTGAPEPKWYELVNHVHKTDEEASKYEHRETGELVRVIKYHLQEIQITERDWNLMWDHVACRFTILPFWSMDALECRTLHKIWNELTAIPETWNTWRFPIGQKIQILLTQIEARLGGLHRRNKTHGCCSNPRHHEDLGFGLKEYLTKEEAAAVVIEERKARKETLHAHNYDVVIMDLLNVEEKIERGVVKFVQKTHAKPKSKKAAKRAMMETDVNAKIEVQGGSNAKVKIGRETDTNHRTETTPNKIQKNEDEAEKCALTHVKAEKDTPMSG
ncbi:MAG: hypothetical protein M1830_001428 [Pleopsidium flavum]|nr:MAG: hypothetical protein M1830_001428 [Pleopsidium flavum]